LSTTTPPPTPPPTPPSSPTVPLADEIRAAYEDLYDKLETEYQSNPDATARQAIGPLRDNIDDVLTKDDMCRFEQNTAQFQALLQQISDTNTGLKTLQTQVSATASHFKTAGAILGAITKVLSLIP
jgi:hypothetical protein